LCDAGPPILAHETVNAVVGLTGSFGILLELNVVVRAKCDGWSIL